MLVGEGQVALVTRYDGNVANRALELLGKQQGMFIDRHEVGQPNEFANWTNEELEAFIKSGTKPLGIAPGKPALCIVPAGCSS